MEEIEQHNKELRKENQELKDSCVGLQQQNSDMQAELHKKEVWLLVKHKPENKQTKNMNLDHRGQNWMVSLIQPYLFCL